MKAVLFFYCLSIICGSYGQIVLSATKSIPPEECSVHDVVCEDEKEQYEAIKFIHKQIDDDKDGNVDLEESDEFFRNDLHYEDSFERHEMFHNHDALISVEDLWNAWKYSTVYNWTVDDVVEWLERSVGLPQFEDNFRRNNVDGRQIPKIASHLNYKTGTLGIKSSIHKQRLSLKAVDVVLFGPPGKTHSYWKDLLLITSILLAVGGAGMALAQHRNSKRHIAKMSRDLGDLQQAEAALKDMSQKLKDAEALAAHDDDKDSDTDVDRVRLLEEELEETNLALQRAEALLANSGGSRWQAPPNLQIWLQITYEIESKYYQIKRAAAEKSLQAAKEGTERIKKKRAGLMGAIRMAHDSSMDDVDQKILLAKSALEEVSQDLDERQQRWLNVEALCDFSIINNPGLQNLESALRGSKTGVCNGTTSAPLDVEEADEDIPPYYRQAAAGSGIHSVAHRGGGAVTFGSVEYGSSASASVVASRLHNRHRDHDTMDGSYDNYASGESAQDSITPGDSISQVGGISSRHNHSPPVHGGASHDVRGLPRTPETPRVMFNVDHSNGYHTLPHHTSPNVHNPVMGVSGASRLAAAPPVRSAVSGSSLRSLDEHSSNPHSATLPHQSSHTFSQHVPHAPSPLLVSEGSPHTPSPLLVSEGSPHVPQANLSTPGEESSPPGKDDLGAPSSPESQLSAGSGHLKVPRRDSSPDSRVSSKSDDKKRRLNIGKIFGRKKKEKKS